MIASTGLRSNMRSILDRTVVRSVSFDDTYVDLPSAVNAHIGLTLLEEVRYDWSNDTSVFYILATFGQDMAMKVWQLTHKESALW